MNLVPGLPRVMTAVICFATLAACTSSAADEKPTLTEAAKHLIAEGNRLLSSGKVAEVGRIEATERADKASPCVPGKEQRFFRAHGDFTRPAWETPGTAVGSLRSALRTTIDYEEVVDELDIRDEGVAVAALRNPKTAVTFVIVARTSKPNIIIVGKTDCLEP